VRLYLIRHGETDYNREQRMQGHGPVPLNAAGIDQVTRLARRVASESSIDHIYASDLKRTEMTAEILARHTRAPITYDALFRERDPGDLSGKTYDEARRFFTELPFVPPNGESVEVFLDRVRRGMDRLISAEGANGRSVALVTHGMFCRGFMQVCLNRDPFEVHAWRNACLTIADYSPTAGWSVHTLACIAHLDQEDAPAHATGA
jgi:broad specificity phosphatase PhoE